MAKTRTKKIIDLVTAKKEALNQPGKPGSDAAAANKLLAVAAVTGGIKSAAWEKYMTQFVDNSDQEQLMRLLATDGSDTDQGLIDSRAYLVSNGVCGEGTKLRFDENVKTLDRDLEDSGCEPTPKN